MVEVLGKPEHKRIYLQPECECNGDEGRLWCKDDQGPYDECGKNWVAYNLATAQAKAAEERET